MTQQMRRYLLRPGHEAALRGAACYARLPAGLTRKDMPAGSLLLPALINAHDHGYGIRTLDFGCLDDALELWIPFLRLRPRTDPYLEALVAFSRLALGGVGATMHCHNSLNVDRLPHEARAVVKAAADVGIRLSLSCPLLDMDAWAYDGGPQRLKPWLKERVWTALAHSIPDASPIQRQIDTVEQIAAEHAGAMVDVQYGPIGPQWCSDALLQAIAAASAATGRRIHMHLLESQRQRLWLDQRFAQGVVRYLDDIGFLSPRLAVAHGVYLREHELDLLAQRGVQLVSNPSANLRLRSGVAPLTRAADNGLAFALGLDGTGFDDDQDMWREMRLAYLLHGGNGLRRTLTAAQVFDAVHQNGSIVVNHAVGDDVVLVDYAALLADSLFSDLEETQVLLTRMCNRHVIGLWVDGQCIVRNGQLQRVDLCAARRELLAQARADLPRLRQQRTHARAIAQAAQRYYATVFAS